MGKDPETKPCNELRCPPRIAMRYWKAMGFLMGLSIMLAFVSRSLPVSLVTPIPVANFYDRTSGTSANGVYFLGMYLAALAMLPVVISMLRPMILPGLPTGTRLMGVLVFLGVGLFGVYLCVLMPATTRVGGGRFSMLLLAAANWPIAFGIIYGLFFYVTVFFLGFAIAGARGTRVSAP